MPVRNGSAQWRGDLKSGAGTLRVGAGAFEGAYTFKSRFEEGEGTNPEELVATAHAACLAMALSNMLASDGHVPDSVRVEARVELRNVDGAATLARVALEVEGEVPGIDEAAFIGYAERAKRDCPISRALAAIPQIDMTARLL